MNRIEKVLFYVVLVLNLFPVLLNTYFPSADGPSHEYNASLIRHILTGDAGRLNDFFMFNPGPVPNWSGHIIMAILQLLFSGAMAEKLLVLGFLAALPIAFRNLLKTLNPESTLLSFLIYPFTYSFILISGFYNFLIGVVFILVALRKFIIVYRSGKVTAKDFFVLAALVIAIYFSHVVGFITFILFLASFIITEIINDGIKTLKSFGYKGGLLFSGMILIPVCLTVWYFTSRPLAIQYYYLSRTELIASIATLRPIMSFNILKEIFYAMMLIYLFVLCGVWSIVGMILGTKKTNPVSTGVKLLKLNFILVNGIILLFLYFVLPDSNGFAGYASVRFAFLFFIMAVLWIASQRYPHWIKILSVGVILFVQGHTMMYYYTSLKDLNGMAANCNETAGMIKPGSIVLPILRNDYWLVHHYSSYLGADKPMVIMDNYEAETNYFPVHWKDETMPRTLLGDSNYRVEGCLSWGYNRNKPSEKIDYVFILGAMREDTCDQKIMIVIDKSYQLIFKNESCTLYERKKS